MAVIALTASFVRPVGAIATMSKPSKVELMPPNVREWLEKTLIDRSFSGYKELESLMKEKGFDISHAAIHRHGQKLERRLMAIKTSTEACKIIAEVAPDQADHRSAATMALIQTALFDALVDVQEAEECQDPAKKIKLLNGAAIGFSMLVKSSLAQKKWAAEIVAKLDMLEEKAKKDQAKGNKSLDLETIQAIREAVYGR